MTETSDPQPREGRRIGYARCSTAEQTLAHQLDHLRKAQCVEIFQDKGVSGAQAARPGLDAALAALEKGDQLVVYKLDRLGRSVQHLSDVLADLNARGVQFVSLTEGIDTTTIGGKLVFHIFSAVAEFGRDLIRENTIAGLEAARARGSNIGRPRRLSEQDCEVIRSDIDSGVSTSLECAQRYGVSLSTIHRAIRVSG